MIFLKIKTKNFIFQQTIGLKSKYKAFIRINKKCDTFFPWKNKWLTILSVRNVLRHLSIVFFFLPNIFWQKPKNLWVTSFKEWWLAWHRPHNWKCTSRPPSGKAHVETLNFGWAFLSYARKHASVNVRPVHLFLDLGTF